MHKNTTKKPLNQNRMKKEEFIKKAKLEKANFELHIKLIEYHLCDREDKDYSNDIKEFAEKQVIDGNLLLSLMEYAEEYSQKKEYKHINEQVEILKDTLEELMIGFDSEENRMDFILDICNGYRKRVINL